MIICKQYDNKKEKLLKLLDATAEKAEKNKIPAILYTLTDGKYKYEISGFALKDKYGEAYIIGVCDKDLCIYFITDLLGTRKIIKSQLSKKDWRNTARYIIFEAWMNDKIDNAFDGTPVASLAYDAKHDRII
mgnify:CR=1 FL=1